MSGINAQFIILLINIAVTAIGWFLTYRGQLEIKRKEYVIAVIEKHISTIREISSTLTDNGIEQDIRKLRQLSNANKGILDTFSIILLNLSKKPSNNINSNISHKLETFLYGFRKSCSFDDLELPNGYESRSQLSQHYFFEIESMIDSVIIKYLES